MFYQKKPLYELYPLDYMSKENHEKMIFKLADIEINKNTRTRIESIAQKLSPEGSICKGSAICKRGASNGGGNPLVI